MPHAALPFRSRVPTTVDHAVSSIESQAAEVRRRVNRFILERVLFVMGGAAFASLTVLVLMALRLSRLPFAVMTWLTLTVLVVVSLVSARRAARGWLPKAQAALRIDHRAALDDRLAT